LVTLHHLDNSRSLRILWLFEELELRYDLVEHKRDAVTRLAPPSLEAVHRLGKAPVLVDGDRTIIESGAIIDYVIRRHGGGRLAPPVDSADYDSYQMWLHYVEGSAMLPVMLNLYASLLGGESPALRSRIDSELARHLGFIEASLAGREFLVGTSLSGADIQLGFLAEMLGASPLGARYPLIAGWLGRMQARPAYLRAVERGGVNVLSFRRARPANS
jgi:glutathione S-transferase